MPRFWHLWIRKIVSKIAKKSWSIWNKTTNSNTPQNNTNRETNAYFATFVLGFIKNIRHVKEYGLTIW